MEQIRTKLEENRELLARLDERTSNLDTDIKKLSELLEKFEKSYVKKEEFLPIQRTIYAIFGIIGTIVAAIIGQIIVKGLHI